MLIFFNLSFDLTEFFFFYFLNFSVISSVLGILIIVFMVKAFGREKVLFWDFIIILVYSFFVRVEKILKI